MVSKNFSWRMVSEWSSQNRLYRWIELSLPRISKEKRRKILDTVLDDNASAIGFNPVGLMEWWTKGSIVSKPTQKFFIIVILEKL
jgi:hypothetical protein